MKLCLYFTLYHGRSHVFPSSRCHWLKSWQSDHISRCVTLITVLLLQMLCNIIIWPSHAAHGFLDFVHYSKTPWVLHHISIYVVYSYSEKPSYSYRCSTRGFWQCYWFFIILFFFLQWTNKCMINWQFIMLLLIILLLHVSILLCNLQGACSQYLPNYINRSAQSWW